MKFINRKKELNFLEERWTLRKSQFIIVYGKRRVGKTELIKQFIKNKPSIYFLADNRSEIEQLKELGKLIGKFFNDSILTARGFTDWLEVFKYLKEKIEKQIVFVVDEYPYLVGVNKATSSLFQKGWDEYLKDRKIFFIISGSSVSMMEAETLIYKAPLYGRRTGQILLKPFSYEESWQFFPKNKFSDFLNIFAITGGIPTYLLQIDPNLSLKENIQQKIFRRTEFLHNEVEFILKEELREPKNYLAILKAISWGKNKFGEIVNETGLAKNVLTKYLTVLEKLQIIEKEVSITEKIPAKSRKGLYRISDNFVRFWFQYIFPYKSDLELERFEEVLRKTEETFNILEAIVYEKVCQEILWNLREKIFPFERVGRWWDKEKEIDVVAISSKTNQILFGEVKWSGKRVGTNIYHDLKEKAKNVRWGKSNREEYYILFSKSGFTKDMKKLAKEENVFLVQRDQLLTI